MSITSQEFRDWAASFGKRIAYRGLKSEREEGESGIQISQTLEKIRTASDLADPDDLIWNLLYACFQADAALSLGSDPAEARRIHFQNGSRALASVRNELKLVASFFEANPELVSKALQYPISPLGKHDRPRKKYSAAVPPRLLADSIAPALRQIVAAHEIASMNEDASFADQFADCAEGPLLFHHRNEIRGRSSGPKKDYCRVVEDGLIFHLTYISRYFTGGSGDPYCQAKVRSDGELMVNGSMIEGGKANSAAIAHLVNATMGRKKPKEALSGGKVKDSLKALLRPSVNETLMSAKLDRRAQPFSSLEFIGWPVPEKHREVSKLIGG